jgi:hypothetical protein
MSIKPYDKPGDLDEDEYNEDIDDNSPHNEDNCIEDEMTSLAPRMENTGDESHNSVNGYISIDIHNNENNPSGNEREPTNEKKITLLFIWQIILSLRKKKFTLYHIMHSVFHLINQYIIMNTIIDMIFSYVFFITFFAYILYNVLKDKRNSQPHLLASEATSNTESNTESIECKNKKLNMILFIVQVKIIFIQLLLYIFCDAPSFLPTLTASNIFDTRRCSEYTFDKGLLLTLIDVVCSVVNLYVNKHESKYTSLKKLLQNIRECNFDKIIICITISELFSMCKMCYPLVSNPLYLNLRFQCVE